MSREYIGWILATLLISAGCAGPTENTSETQVSVAASDTLLASTEVLYVFDQGAPDGDIVIGPHAQVYFPHKISFINHKLTVLEGSVLTFAEGAYLNFEGRGSLQIRGTEADSVYLRPADGKHWGLQELGYTGGLAFSMFNSGSSSVEYAVIDSAITGVWAKNDAGMKIAHSRISHSLLYGLHLAEHNSLAPNGIRHCRFVDNKEYDIYMRRPSLLLHLGDSLSVQHDLKIAVTSGTIDSIGRIENPGSPVRVLGEITISEVYGNAAVTVAAGTAFLMDTGSGWWAQWGSLTLEGTPDAPIRLSPLRPGTYWDGIEANSKVSLSHVELDSAEIGIESVRHANVEIRNSVIRGCSQFGLLDKYGDGMLGDSGLANTHFVSNAQHVSLAPDNLAAFADGNTFDSAGAIILNSSNEIAQNVRVRAYDAPYHVMVNVNAFADTAITVQIDPGVRMLFAQGKRISIGNNARLLAIGTAADSIVLDEQEAGEGWGGSAFDAGGVYLNYNANPPHQLSYVSLRHAGQGVYVDGGQELNIEHSTFSHITRYGIYLANGSILNEGEGVTYEEYGDGTVHRVE